MNNIRYVTYKSDGTLDGCFLQVPPADHADRLIEIDEAIAANWLSYRANDARDGLELLPPAQDESQIIAGYMVEVQRHMDARAVEFGYDDLISVITYADEPSVERYQAEGRAFRAWRSACWFACEQMLAAVKAGDRAAPTHAELIDELPTLGIAPAVGGAHG